MNNQLSENWQPVPSTIVRQAEIVSNENFGLFVTLDGDNLPDQIDRVVSGRLSAEQKRHIHAILTRVEVNYSVARTAYKFGKAIAGIGFSAREISKTRGKIK